MMAGKLQRVCRKISEPAADPARPGRGVADCVLAGGGPRSQGGGSTLKLLDTARRLLEFFDHLRDKQLHGLSTPRRAPESVPA